MNKILLSTLLLTLLSCNMAKAIERTIGYCPDDLSTDVYPVGVSGQQAYVGAAIRFPESRMQSLVGNQITKIRIAAKNTMKNVRIWLREGALTGSAVVSQSVSALEDGWTEVTLDTPYDIDGGEIYVGYNGRQPSGDYCIWLAGDDNPNAMFINDGSTWDDYYGQGWGSLTIQIVVSGDNFVDNDLAIDRITFDNDYYKSGDELKASVDITNQGLTSVSKFGLSYQIDGGDVQTTSVNSALDASASTAQAISLSTQGLSEGAHTLKVFFNNSADFGDQLALNDTLTQTFLVYEKEYTRRLLLEHFTTINCINCPYGDKTLAAATSGRDDYAWVSHHAGYGTDELTISESKSLLNFGVTGAPMAMLDRTYVENLSDNTNYPPFSVGYSDAKYGGELISAWMDIMKQKVSMVSLEATCQYDEDSRSLTVTVDGECNGIFRQLYPGTCLNVFLTENNVTAKTVQTGTTNGYTHYHVLRDVLTDTFGDEIEWNGDSFTMSYTTTLNSNWKADDMNVVAFVTKPYSSSDVDNAEVQNTTIANATPTSGISSLHNGNAKATITDGKVVVDGAYDSLSVYTADGKQVATSGLNHGLYIVKLSRAGHTTTTKIAY